ncbi:leucine-rich repeat flightless-interacting protein 2 [Danio aesculapii]|uniref:leucine-rich repeat flightless-interacting protein 2 n=1 Tax=Danio aesculapii TaxID=1142201 RepID=UPI0024BF8C9D|nr:leucine-rich repeat flightless-interacting protein 2 [Danio aesculapii]
MQTGQLEKSGSLRKRTLSRGMSEDESLRHIIREAEESGRHLSRSDSRYGSLKRGQTCESLSEDDVLSETIELEELRALALQQEALLFQVDCLQDALEGTEEMLAEAQRETQRSTAELERERAVRRRLELELISLQQELERLREERSAEQLQKPSSPVWLQAAPEGSSVDRDEPLNSSRSVLDGDPDNEESSGYEDAPSEFTATPDRDPLDTEEDPENNPSSGPNPGDSCALC